MKVGICIATYRRPQALERCLRSLGEARIPQDAEIEVFVVDNDPTASAKRVVETLSPILTFPLHYCIEPRKGIPFARNKAARLAASCTFIAFIDDDETVHRDWLVHLLEAQRRFEADLVAGPALPVLDPQAPEWALTSRLFHKRRMPTGERIDWASTCNCLVRTSKLFEIPGPFDQRLANTGGSDRLLTLQLSRRGCKLVWCDEALVMDHIPLERTTAKWYLQRKYREGNTIAVCEALLPPNIRKGMHRVAAKALLSLVLTLPHTPRLIVPDTATRLKILGRLLTSIGILAGLLGHRYREYDRQPPNNTP
ncbi:glycosyl transferase family 2 [Thermobaculum terrenum ATCC BAA-798]|uniref:Glycosyl transferase family 2 n=1 Tax=Thermobaculum terrenum (strain ATCC BAA-798 / CCMEE 7001 / YNP1) TaxID=525904 RepID=D1CIW4_THET1|nr:glycosyltransferase family 2 protein [Thermobaculum terrenum]ACZ43684.1 glycosyl transferase family 2 [Thermobaculum terrenum ATCC BAA-798]